MKRGTRVGAAYVALTVDGDGINEEIVDSVDEAGPGVEKAGREHGKRYTEGFDEESKGRFAKIAENLGSGLKEKFRKNGDDSGKEFAHGLNNQMSGAGLEHVGDRIGANIGGHMLAALVSAIDRESGLEDNPIADLFDKWSRSAENRLTRKGANSDLLGDRLGGLFGSGSRNNALNLFGKSLEHVINLAQRGYQVLGGFFKTFSTGMGEVEEGAGLLTRLGGGFSALGSSIGESLGSLIASGPAAVAAALVLTAALSALASIMGALIGIATALVATIAGALVGALGVGSAALVAIGAAAGLAVIAFTSLTDAQKKALAADFAPLKNELVGIGQLMLTNIIPYFHQWSSNLQGALNLLIPLAHLFGDAFGRAGNILTQAFSGPGFALFAQQLGVYLPGIITGLSRALGGFLNGILGLFSALLPFVSQFSTYLARVASTFAAWATSAAGQNSIHSFFDRALTSLKALWDALGAFGGLFDQIFFSSSAMSQGNSIFASIASSLRKMTAAVAQAQANGSFQKWLKDAAKFGGDLWSVIQALYKLFVALYDSGVLKGVGLLFDYIAGSMNIAARGVSILLGPLDGLISKMGLAGNTAVNMFNNVANATKNAANVLSNYLNGLSSAGSGLSAGASSGSVSGVQSSGASAIAVSNIPKIKTPKVKTYKNPYKAYAASLMNEGPSTKTQLAQAMASLNSSAAAGIAAGAKAANGADLLSGFNDTIKTLQDGAKSVVDTARTALNSAAQALSGASSAAAAKAALKKVKQAQKDMTTALNDQVKINNAAKILAASKVIKTANVNSLVAGLKTSNVTLAEYAAARAIIATKLDTANTALANAIQIRDSYKDQIASSIRAFGDLTTAQAQVINGVTQALTATDVTSNLQDRLDQIKHFQADLQQLLAQGLSNDAYKSIVDQGVSAGTPFADALLSGGQGAISQTNSLVSQINSLSDQLGVDTSNRLYQAGVSAAQGLVDGLTSQAAALDKAAAALGTSIANAVKKQLGIKSPSRVLRDMMDYVGDGAVLGLDNQHVKVGAAAARLGDQIAVSPEVAAHAASQGQAPAVSGNSWTWTGDIVTPTEDPHAVATEALNEITARMP